MWRLEEAAVLPQDLGFGVAGGVGEAWGDMDDGVVGLCGVDDDERRGHVDWAEGDLGIWSDGNVGEDIEQVEAWCGVDGEAFGEQGAKGDEDWAGDGFELYHWGRRATNAKEVMRCYDITK